MSFFGTVEPERMVWEWQSAKRAEVLGETQATVKVESIQGPLEMA